MTDAKKKTRQFALNVPIRDAAAEAQALLDAHFDGPNSPTRERAMWDRFLNHTDPRLQFEAFKLLKSYASGKPTEKKDVPTGPTPVAEVPDKLSDEDWAKKYGQGITEPKADA